jgi:ABC-2 type transport system ATP-binding protein
VHPLVERAQSIAVEGLVVRFGELEAVAGISFEVEPGEVFGLLGPNGAGKTTTLRVLTTLLRPTEGHAYVLGHDVQRHSVLVRTAIGYVPQAISVDPALTGRENLEFYARVTGVPRDERRARIDDVAEVMGVAAFSGRLARSLSGGMLRRLEIASALLNRPAVLFLDEPTVGLDPTARRLVWERLAALRAEAGTSLLVTTHLMEEAELRCDRVAIMDRGRIAAQGTAAELRAETGTTSLDEVFAAVTGHGLDDEEGSFRGIRAGRRLVRRLG